MHKKATSFHPLGHELSLRRRLVHGRRAAPGGRGPCGKDGQVSDCKEVSPRPSLTPGGRGRGNHSTAWLVCPVVTPDRFQISTHGGPRASQISTGSTPLSPSTWGITPTKKVVYAYTNHGLRKSGVTDSPSLSILVGGSGVRKGTVRRTWCGLSK